MFEAPGAGVAGVLLPGDSAPSSLSGTACKLAREVVWTSAELSLTIVRDNDNDNDSDNNTPPMAGPLVVGRGLSSQSVRPLWVTWLVKLQSVETVEIPQLKLVDCGQCSSHARRCATTDAEWFRRQKTVKVPQLQYI